MIDQEGLHEVFFWFGELWFGGGDVRVCMFFGFCVVVMLWYLVGWMGGMCYYMILSCFVGMVGYEFNGCYVDEVIFMFFDGVVVYDIFFQEYQVKMFGGGSQFVVFVGFLVDVVVWNVEVGLWLFEFYGLRLSAMYLGGMGYWQVIFDFVCGDVWMWYVDISEEMVL